MGYLLKYDGFKVALYENSVQELEELAKSQDWQERNSILKYHGKIPRDILERLARDPDPNIPRNLLRSQHVDEDLIKIISEHEIEEVRKDVADSEKTQAHVLLKLAKDANHGVRWTVAENPNSTDAVLKEIAKKEPTRSSFILGAISKNPNATPELLYELTKKVVDLELTDENNSYRSHLEKLVTSKKLDERSLSLINEIGLSTGEHLRRQIVRYYKLSDELQRKIVEEGDLDILGELAMYQSALAKDLQQKIANLVPLDTKYKLLNGPSKIDVDILDQLSKDPNGGALMQKLVKDRLDKTDFTDWVFKETWE